MNAERILIAAECVGDGDLFVERAAKYVGERVVFGRPIGQNQGVQFPIARAHAAVFAADLMRKQAAALFDAGRPCGAEANTAKLLASEASWQAANASIDAHGGYGFADEYDVERKFRETRLYITAPVANNLILAVHRPARARHAEVVLSGTSASGTAGASASENGGTMTSWPRYGVRQTARAHGRGRSAAGRH